MTKYLSIVFMIIILILLNSCFFNNIENPEWDGTSNTIMTNGNFTAEYPGIVEYLLFDSDDSCILKIRDDFLTGEITLKEYKGTFRYDFETYNLRISLILETIDDKIISDNMQYNVNGTNTFNLNNSGGVLNVDITEGDLPPTVTIDVALDITPFIRQAIYFIDSGVNV